MQLYQTSAPRSFPSFVERLANTTAYCAGVAIIAGAPAVIDIANNLAARYYLNLEEQIYLAAVHSGSGLGLAFLPGLIALFLNRSLYSFTLTSLLVANSCIFSLESANLRSEYAFIASAGIGGLAATLGYTTHKICQRFAKNAKDEKGIIKKYALFKVILLIMALYFIACFFVASATFTYASTHLQQDGSLHRQYIQVSPSEL